MMASADYSGYLAVGEVLRPHGIRGSVKVRPLTDNLRRYDDLDYVFVESDGELVRKDITALEYAPNSVLLRLEGVNDANLAESLRGSTLYIREDQRVSLPEGSFFIYEMIGVGVETEDGRSVGEVTDVIPNPANDIYVVEGRGKTHYIPAVRAIVTLVDTERRLMIVRWIDGL